MNKEGEVNTKGALYIPHEIVITEILSLLQAKSLFRFKSVCKLWHETLSDYRFVRSNNYNNKPKFIVACPFDYCCFDFTLISPEDGHIITSWLWPWRYANKPQKTHRTVLKDQVVNSCNGLLLVVFQDTFYLWNPVTRFPIKVLESLPFYDMADYLCGRQLFIIGLCHDSRPWKDEYKVLVMVTYLRCGRYFPSIFVCALKEKRWKEIPFPLDDLDVCKNIGKIKFEWMLNFNGMLHWVFSYFFTKTAIWTRKQVIMYYKPATDEIKELPKPERANYRMLEIVGSLTLSGHFSILLRNRDSVELLSMNEYGVKDSWECMLVFKDPRRGSMNLYCLVAQTLWHSKMMNNDGEIDELQVSRRLSGTEIIKFNRKRQTHERIVWTYHKALSTRALSVVEYVESLVSPTGYGWSEEHASSSTSC